MTWIFHAAGLSFYFIYHHLPAGMDSLYSMFAPPPPEHDPSQLVVATLSMLVPLATIVLMPKYQKVMRKVCNGLLLLQMISTGLLMVAAAAGFTDVPDELRYTEVGKADKFEWGAKLLSSLSPAFIGITAPHGIALLCGTCQLLAAASFITGVKEITAELCAAAYYSLILYGHYVLVDNMIIPSVFIGACLVKITKVDQAFAKKVKVRLQSVWEGLTFKNFSLATFTYVSLGSAIYFNQSIIFVPAGYLLYQKRIGSSTSGGGGGKGKSAKERLGELKELLDAELISQAEFDGQRAMIIQSL